MNTLDAYCRCADRLDYDDKMGELDRILRSRIDIKRSTKKIIICSFAENAMLGLGAIGIRICKGVNIICLCNLPTFKHEFELKISSYPLCELKEASCKMENTQGFTLQCRGHSKTCPDLTFPTLRDWAYFATFLAGFLREDLKALSENGQIPKWVYDERPKTAYCLLHLTIQDLIPFWMPILVQPTLACEDPIEHLHYDDEDLVDQENGF